MQLLSSQPLTTALFLISITLLLSSMASAHNITRILASHKDFATFNEYLTKTHLAEEINTRQTITILAVDNAAMSTLLSKNLPISSIKNVLSLHVLLDYFDAKKLHQISNGSALSATMYQATGDASGSSGFVNITDLKGGKVGFTVSGPIAATFVEPIESIPYNISVIRISNLLPSAEAEAPAPSPTETNLTSIMSAHGCKVFADTLTADSAALATFNDDLAGGLTVFCPGDEAFKSFLPKFKNLTADGKSSLLLFHGLPVYNSLTSLRSNNGVMNTLATDGAKKFDLTVQNDGNDVTIDTKRVVARITGTVMDEQPVAIFSIDKVLLPKELFNSTKSASAPAPEPAAADAPKSSEKKKKDKKKSDESDTPSDAPSDEADQSAADNNSNDAVRFDGLSLTVLMGLMMIIIIIMV